MLDLDFDFNDYEDIDQVATKEKRVYFDLEESFKRLKQKMRMPEKNESIRTISPAGGWSSCSLLMYLANEEVIDELFITTLRVGKKEMAALTDLMEQRFISGTQTVRLMNSERRARIPGGQSSSVLYGIKTQWCSEDKTINGSTSLAYMDGKMGLHTIS